MPAAAVRARSGKWSVGLSRCATSETDAHHDSPANFLEGAGGDGFARRGQCLPAFLEVSRGIERWTGAETAQLERSPRVELACSDIGVAAGRTPWATISISTWPAW